MRTKSFNLKRYIILSIAFALLYLLTRNFVSRPSPQMRLRAAWQSEGDLLVVARKNIGIFTSALVYQREIKGDIEDNIYLIAGSPDEKYLVGAYDIGITQVWNVKTGLATQH